MNQFDASSTLAIIHSSTRAGHYTAPALHRVGLRHVTADLAYCGSAVRQADNPYAADLSYDWQVAEPEDIGSLLRDVVPDALWQYLLNPDNSDGLATTAKKQQLWLSGLIQWHYKKLALEQARLRSLRERYSWFAFLRSDYLFTSPLPPLAHHPPRALVLQGDNYGGINDRLLVFPTHQFDTVAKIFDLSPFADLNLVADLSRFMALDRHNNPERLLYFQMTRTGLASDTDALPQLGFCVRPDDESSRWSMGLYSPTRRVFIKYPTELAFSKITSSPWTAKQKPFGSPRPRPLNSPTPRYVTWVTTAGYHRATRLAPLLLLLGEGRIAWTIWKAATRKNLRKTYRRWRKKNRGE